MNKIVVSRNKRILLTTAAVVAAAVALFLCLYVGDVGEKIVGNKVKRNHLDRVSAYEDAANVGSTKAVSQRKSKGKSTVDLFGDLPPADRLLAEEVQTALDNEDYAATLQAASKALDSTNANVRLHAVEALGWFGKKALVELTPCMADPDEEVARAAANAWEMALSEIDKATERLDVSLLALKTITDKDVLTLIGNQFANAASELIEDVDDEAKSSAKRVEVIQSVVDMIVDAHPARSKAACAIYEDITGHEWISIDEAERYLADPESYEPSSDDESVQTNEKALDNT